MSAAGGALRVEVSLKVSIGRNEKGGVSFRVIADHETQGVTVAGGSPGGVIEFLVNGQYAQGRRKAGNDY